MAKVYQNTFATYPFPIHDPEYLKQTMESHIVYFVVRDGSRIVALASAETDGDSQNVEVELGAKP